MKLFLFDLWHDLRQKRLWPVAALLVVGLVAVPVVLSKPAEDPLPAPAPAQAPQAEQDLKGLAKVVLADQEAGKGSKLNLFDSSDPFKPPKSAMPEDETADESGAPTDSSAGSETAGSPLGSGGSEVGSLGGGEPTAPTAPQPSPTPKTKTVRYTYVIDVTFKHGDRTRKIKGMDRLETLPNDETPLLLFLGASADANSAVFLVDSRLQPRGEGRCKPSADDCSFLYLGAGNEHYFTDENNETYTLRVDEIRRVRVDDKSKSKSKAKSKSKQSKQSRAGSGRQRAQTAKQSAKQTRPFVPPLLVDLVTVSSDDFNGSSSSRRDR